MQFVTALLAATGFVGTILGIHSWYTSYRRTSKEKYSIIAIIIAAIVFLTFLFASLVPASAGKPTGTTISPTSTRQVSGNSHQELNSLPPPAPAFPPIDTPTLTHTSTPTDTPTPTPIPTPIVASIKPGTVLYTSDWSSGMDGWSAGNGSKWTTVSGMLVHGRSSSSDSVYAPVQLSTPNYAVVTRIQAVNLSISSNFSILVRSDTNNNGYWIEVDNYPRPEVSIHPSGNLNAIIQQVPYSIDNAWHTYRVEVKGEQIRVFLDDKKLLDATDTQFLTPGVVGLNAGSVDTQLNVSSFEVIAL